MAVILPHFTNSELNCEELDCKPGVYTGLVDHASRLGIRLRTPGRTPYYNNGKRRFTDIKKNREGNSVQFYGEKVLLPVHMTPLADEAMLRPSTSRLSQRTTVKSSTSQSALSHLPQSEHGNLLPKIDVPVSSVPTETSVLLDSNRGKLWNKSGQALRFQQEQENREKSKALKRTSVIQSHRVDRMYYISGSSLPIAGKYEVDEKEMGKLQDMSQIRKKAPHYGRGLSKYKYLDMACESSMTIPLNLTEERLESMKELMKTKRLNYSKKNYSKAQLSYLKKLFEKEIMTLRWTMLKSPQKCNCLIRDSKRLPAVLCEYCSSRCGSGKKKQEGKHVTMTNESSTTES